MSSAFLIVLHSYAVDPRGVPVMFIRLYHGCERRARQEDAEGTWLFTYGCHELTCTI